MRDVLWHPSLPLLLSASFDGSLGVWAYDGSEPAAQQREWRKNRSANAASIAATLAATNSEAEPPVARRLAPVLLPDGLTTTAARTPAAVSPELRGSPADGGEDGDGEGANDSDDDYEQNDIVEAVRNALFSDEGDGGAAADPETLQELLAMLGGAGAIGGTGSAGRGSGSAEGGRN